MKAKLFLAVMGAIIFSCPQTNANAATVSNDIASEPRVTIQSKSANATSGEITFEAETTSAGIYSLNIWQCPARKNDNTLQSYSIELNGLKLKTAATPTTAGWSALSYTDAIYLKTGKNSITVKSDLPAIPNVELIELIKKSNNSTSKLLTSQSYANYVSDIRAEVRQRAIDIGGGQIEVNPDTALVVQPIPSLVPFGFSHRYVDWFGYTFYTTSYFSAGQTVTCSSEGINNINHILEVFSADMADQYSWYSFSNSECKNELTITIPRSGTYYVKVRTFKNGTKGFCNLNINNQIHYEEVPICSMGFKSSFASTQGIYDIFTTNTNSDPVLWITVGGTYKSKVYAFNDNYASTGDFNWGKNARIKRNFPALSDNARIIITSAGSFNPVGKCEVYIGCKQSPVTTYFEKLKADDAIESAPASWDYNCIAWSGGMASIWEWPADTASSYCIEGDPLASFDLFYSSQRYPGCTTYTRTGATANNSAVDLWGFTYDDSTELTHASIYKNSDINWHGYDWESKPGALTRTFHPRNALEGYAYGKVLYHYRASNSYQTSKTLEQSISENRAIMERVSLSAAQTAMISNNIANIDTQAKSKFNNLYSAWETTWRNSVFSNPSKIKKETSYQTLLKACKDDVRLWYLVYDKINKGNPTAIPLFEDLVLKNNTSNMQKMRSIHLSNSNSQYDADGKRIVRTISSNLKLLLKRILPESQNAPHKAKQGFSIPANSFNVCVKDNNADIQLSLGTQSDVAIDVIDLEGRTVNFIIKQEMEQGSYRFTSEIPYSGVFLVRCMVNGHLDVKKIIINK